MRISTWRVALRLAWAVALATLVVAVVLGRLYGPQPDFRRLRPVGLVGLSKDYRLDPCRETRLINPATGDVLTLPMPEGEVLEFPSLAPWSEPDGRSQVVGRWVGRKGEGIAQTGVGIGLARVRFPDGEVLDRVRTRVLPGGAPCWLPGVQARVLFAAGDGRLYRLSFEGEPGSGGNGDGFGPRPERMSWRVKDIDPRNLYFVDLVRPYESHLAASGLVLASVQERSGQARGAEFAPAQLWWLRLDSAGTAVVSAGPLTRPGMPERGEDVLRYPTLSAGPEGTLNLAYLARRTEEFRWRLRIAPIELDPADGNPKPLAEAGRVLALGCSPSPIGVSPDGRWVCCVQRTDGHPPRRVIGRFAMGPGDPSPRDVGLASAGPLGPASRGTHH